MTRGRITKFASIWRQAFRRARPAWKAHRPSVLAGAAFIVLVLGYIGFRRYQPVRESWTDALYGALQLFEVQGPQPPVPWQLDVARLASPLIVGYAALRALASIFRDQFELLAVRLLSRHTVIAGLGNTGFRLALALYEEGHKVAVVERDINNPRIRGCRERDIRVVHGDATDPEVLRRVGVRRAAFLLVTCGDDATNIDVAVESRRLNEGCDRVVTAQVHLDDPSLAPLLQADALASGTVGTGMRLQFFNVFEVAARALLDRFPPGIESASDSKIVLAGLDGLGASLALLLARRSVEVSDTTTTVVLVGPEAEHDRDLLVQRHPGIDRVLSLRPVAASDAAALSTIALDPDSGPVSAVYVCTPEETRALAMSLAFAERDDIHGPVVLVVDDAEAGVGAAVSASRGVLASVSPFGVFNAALRTNLLREGTAELVARAKHEHYIDLEVERGQSIASNSSMVPWEKLDEDRRESNRCFADGIGDKLEALGLVLVPAPLDGSPKLDLDLSREDLEDLAREEHARWAEAKKREGWTPTQGPIDSVHKRHPMLVGWEDLPEAERDKDREPVRDLPQILRRAGLTTLSVKDRAHRSTGPEAIAS